MLCCWGTDGQETSPGTSTPGLSEILAAFWWQRQIPRSQRFWGKWPLPSSISSLTCTCVKPEWGRKKPVFPAKETKQLPKTCCRLSKCLSKAEMPICLQTAERGRNAHEWVCGEDKGEFVWLRKLAPFQQLFCREPCPARAQGASGSGRSDTGLGSSRLAAQQPLMAEKTTACMLLFGILIKIAKILSFHSSFCLCRYIHHLFSSAGLGLQTLWGGWLQKPIVSNRIFGKQFLLYLCYVHTYFHSGFFVYLLSW